MLYKVFSIDDSTKFFPIPGMVTQIGVINSGIGKHTSGPSVRGFLVFVY